MARGQSTDRIIDEMKEKAEGVADNGRMTPFGLTVRQEQFAREVAKGSTLSDAYRSAYSTDGWKPENIHSSASELASSPKVAARVRQLLEEQEKRLLRDMVAVKRHVMARLMAESVQGENPAAARIRALELLGKAAGLFKEQEREKDDRKPEDIEAELREKLRDMFKA